MTVPVRASAHSQTDTPPPRSSGLPAAIVLAMLIAGFLPGMILGASLGSPPPPSASWDERCQGAPDTIACLIVMLD